MSQFLRKKKLDGAGLLIACLLLITIGAVCVTIWILFVRKPTNVLMPDYALMEIEKNAKEIPNDNEPKTDSGEAGGNVSLTYSNQLGIDLSDASVSLYFSNPSKSNHNIVLQIVIQDELLAQSGIILSGYQVTMLDLLEDSVLKLSPGGYDGKFVVLFYHPDSGEKAIVHTEIPIYITVKE